MKNGGQEEETLGLVSLFGCCAVLLDFCSSVVIWNRGGSALLSMSIRRKRGGHSQE